MSSLVTAPCPEALGGQILDLRQVGINDSTLGRPRCAHSFRPPIDLTKSVRRWFQRFGDWFGDNILHDFRLRNICFTELRSLDNSDISQRIVTALLPVKSRLP
jgi:hypothetical protein